MRFLAVLGLLLLATPAPEIRYFHFERTIERPTQSPGQTCLVVEPAVFAHASSQIADLRIYQGTTETPFVVRTDVPVVSADQMTALLNLGRSGEKTAFDAAMPAGQYSDLQLGVSGRDFLATVTLTGSQSQTDSSRTSLGSFTIFDLTRQRLGRSTILHLPEANFRYLHFQIAGPIAPDQITGLSVKRTPLSRRKFATVVETADSILSGRNTIIEFTVPPHTPIDRIVFVPGQKPANFSRDVAISVSPVARPSRGDLTDPPQPVVYPGNILRVHETQDGHKIDEEHLAVDAPQVEFAEAAKWTVTIENHDDMPIQLTAIRLEMLERRVCFDATAGNVYTLYYGDATLAAPQYDYASLFVLQQNATIARLGGEVANPAWQPRPDERPFTEKHPILLWVALIAVIALLGAVAFHSFKSTPVRPST